MGEFWCFIILSALKQLTIIPHREGSIILYLGFQTNNIKEKKIVSNIVIFLKDQKKT